MALREHHLFTTDDYEALFATGILTKDDRVELLDGEIVRKPRMNPPHLSSTDKLNRLFVRGLGDRVIVRIQGDVKLPPRSMPQPDVALLRYVDNFWSDRQPEPKDLYLVIEVADSSLRRDREYKIPLYARARLREAWLVDVTAGTITVHRDPARGRYRDVSVHARGESVAPLAFPEFAVSVDEVVP